MLDPNNNINILMKNPFKITMVMAIAIFGVITTEFGLIGGLHLIADSFQVSLSSAGMLLSIYAIIVAVFGPFMTLTFAKYNKKFVLIGAVGLFFVSTMLSAISNSYILMMISRIIGALGHSLVWSLALAIAASCFEPEKRAKSVSYVNLGFITATVIGIPFAAYLSTEFSWRLGFALCALSNLISMIAIIFLIPSLPSKESLTFGNQLSILRKPIVWLNITSTSAMFAAMFSVYGYFASYFTETTGMSSRVISVVLIFFGAFGFLGNNIFGKITTLHNITRIFLGIIITYLLLYTLMSLFNYNFTITIIIILLWGALFAGGGLVAQVWSTMNAREAPEFANSLFVSFANIGITFGTFFGSLSIKYMGISSITSTAIFFLLISLVLYLITINMMKKLKI